MLHVASKLAKKKMINIKDSAEELAGDTLNLGTRPTIEASKDTKLQIKKNQR